MTLPSFCMFVHVSISSGNFIEVNEVNALYSGHFSPCLWLLFLAPINQSILYLKFCKRSSLRKKQLSRLFEKPLPPKAWMWKLYTCIIIFTLYTEFWVFWLFWKNSENICRQYLPQFGAIRETSAFLVMVTLVDFPSRANSKQTYQCLEMLRDQGFGHNPDMTWCQNKKKWETWGYTEE